MIEALLAVITVLVIALCISVYFLIVLQGSKTSLEDDKEDLVQIIHGYKRSEEKQRERLLGGIEEDLAEYRLKIKRIGDYHE